MFKEEFIKEHKLGRVHIPDERDKNFPMKGVLPNKAPSITYKYWWANGWWGDQQRTPHCVAYSWIHWLEDGGVTQQSAPAPILDPTSLYNQCQRQDEWYGENYDGTSVRAGAKVLQEKGFIKEYRWSTDIEEVVDALLTKGPVMLGVNWYFDMYFPDKKGKIKVGGKIYGGHAVEANGVNTKTKMIRIKNSWGQDWGRNGHAYISFDDLQRLLNENGECCLATEIKKSN